MERQRERTTEFEKVNNKIVQWVFHRDGEPIKAFRGSWAAACKKAGVPGKIPHDLRRSAVRRLEQAGVPRSAAMQMVGHKTEAIYRRYAISDESMMKDAAVRLAALGNTVENTAGNVAEFGK